MNIDQDEYAFLRLGVAFTKDLTIALEQPYKHGCSSFAVSLVAQLLGPVVVFITFVPETQAR